ncbi:molybdopterin-dependent oxidoreductase [Myxococcota bacterium]|nr:molybdopterin-dependent oxidoreductase [Myxococcota bacterium]MBU1381766.1 molybdopterin-dependent oxidoreductase [Myxococcota bacterium]MBU1496526.1 molybdopterin-dependent oxidoreductase [Myxococcota bacterium]
MTSSNGNKNISRRLFLEWLGASTVISLGAAAACSATNEKNTMDSGIKDAGSDSGTNYPFSPGEGTSDIFKTWPERTVDVQNIENTLASWKLTVDGMVETPVTLRFHELVELTPLNLLMDFHCVEGWSIWDIPWNGFHINTLKNMVKPLSGVTHITFHTQGGKYNESLPIDVALEPHTLLVYGVDGSTIPLKHGFPLRLVVPRLLAYKSAKYVERIEFTDHPVNGFWVARGYPYDAPVPASRLREGKY